MINYRLASAFCFLVVAGCSEDASTPAGNQDGGADALAEAGLDALGDTSSDGEGVDGNTADADASGGDPQCQQIAVQRCAGMARCLPDTVLRTYGDEDSCVVQERATCEVELSSPAVTFTADDLLACETERNGATCEAYLRGVFYRDPPFAACDLSAGTSADGATCVFSSECASGNCENSSEPECGTCQPLLGPPCNGTQCAPDEVCTSGGSPGESVCSEAAKIGESCDDKPCWDGAPCDNGVCPEPAFGKDGADCDWKAHYPFFFNLGCYILEYRCDSATSTCVPLPTPGAVGGPCEATMQMCEAGAYCSGGICQPPIPWGEACEDNHCKYPAQCIDGTCQVPSIDLCQ